MHNKELTNIQKIILGLQHVFAMFGATVMVPALTGLSVSATLLSVGIGTLIFHCITKFKVPIFLGASFVFLLAYNTIAPEGHKELLPYACFGVACSGFVYILIALFIKYSKTFKIMRYFPPIVTGSIILSIGLTLAGEAINNFFENILIAGIATLTVIFCLIFGKGMIKVIPILIGIFVSYAVASCIGLVDFSAIISAPWVGSPIKWSDTVFNIFFSDNIDINLLITSIFTIAPLAFVCTVEHIGDVVAVSTTIGKNLVKDPGLSSTLAGDGIATIVTSLFGGSANTTYAENISVLNITKIYNTVVVSIAAMFSVLFSFSPKIAALISAIPTATLGGVSLILYGMISAIGVRNLVEAKVDFTKSRNVLIVAIILILSVGINYSSIGSINVNMGSLHFQLSGLAFGSIVGVILNAVLPLNED